MPATGLYDFTFNAFDVEADGAALAGTVVLDAVPVANGVGDPSILAPRTPLLPTPYTIFAGSAGNVANGTVTADQLNTGGVPPAPGQFLSYDGGNLSWSDPGVAVAARLRAETAVTAKWIAA